MAQQTPFPQADRDAVMAFVDCLFRYADGYINLRAFHDLKDGAPPLFVEPIKVGAPNFIERVCERIHEAAAHPEPHVFCPPVCSFTEPNGAATENLAEGVALSVECDSNPYAALKRHRSFRQTDSRRCQRRHLEELPKRAARIQAPPTLATGRADT